MKNENINLMIVDDSRSIRTLMTSFLKEEGFRVTTAEDGQQCLDMIKKQNVEIIISDLNMPNIDGIELCKIIKSDPDLKKIYFILLTTEGALENKLKGFDYGADDYIVKSTQKEELLARVHAGTRILKLESELNDTQEQLYHSEKLASIGQLAAGVAHEINNPMGFITSNINTLANYFGKMAAYVAATEASFATQDRAAMIEELKSKKKELKLDFVLDDIDELIKESLDGAQRVKVIVQDLKDFSRVDAAEVDNIELNKSMDSTINLLHNEMKERVTIVKDYGELPKYQCKPQEINQLFMNILNNASQAIDEQGEVEVKTWFDNGAIFISIRDTGCGIPEENFSKIFEPFFTTKDVGKGKGLGLSTSHNIVENHGGEITVSSEVGKGSVFTIKFPVP